MKARKQASTSYPITFCMVSSSDHVSAVTGLSPTATISKNGGGFASPSGAVTEIANGWYQIAGNATDRNTIGELLVHATGAGADPWDDRYLIVPFDPFDATALGLSNLDAAVSSRGTANPGDAMTLSAGEADAIAEALLVLDWTTVGAPAARSTLNALRKLMNKVAIAAGTLTVYREDDATPAWTQAITTDAAQEPIKALDTA